MTSSRTMDLSFHSGGFIQTGSVVDGGNVTGMPTASNVSSVMADNSQEEEDAQGTLQARRFQRALHSASTRHEDKKQEAEDDMNELDENGWAHVHQAAFRGFEKSVQKFVRTNREQLELETGDGMQSTPLLLAVMGGDIYTVKCLVELGAKVWVLNSQNHGVIELCAFKQFMNLLGFFIELNHERLPVWKNLVRFLNSELDEEVEAAAICLRRLTQGSAEEINPNWQHVYDNGVVPNIVKVIKNTIADQGKVETFNVLLNILTKREVKDQFVSSGGIPALVKLLKSSSNTVIQLAARILKQLCQISEYSQQAAQNGAIPALVKIVQTIRDPEVLVEVAEALGNIAHGDHSLQSSIGSTPGAIAAFVCHYEDCTNKSLLLALTNAITEIVTLNENNQCAFVTERVASHIIVLTRVRNRDLQLAAVAAIHSLVEMNATTQKLIMREQVDAPLMQLLKKSRDQSIQEKTAKALWALAGDDIEERRYMAENMGVQLLIEFTSSLSQDLHFIGSDGLGVLAQGPKSKQEEIARANGVHPLVRLLKSDQEHIVLNVIRTLRHLCVGVGYVAHPKHQVNLAASRGTKFLVALMVHSRDEIIQVEAAQTLACAALCNPDILEEIQQNRDFSYVRILRMMYAKNPEVRVLAGAALATFAYNSIHNQKEIAEEGGVRFTCFVPFLQSEDEYFRCQAAFQVVVLARIIPDEEQAASSAAGIKLLVDILQDSKSEKVLCLAADCIARLAHTRAGVPAAFVSIGTVGLLCDKMRMPEQVSGCCAIALGYLSHHNMANRQLLARCRTDPYLMKILMHYTKNSIQLSPHFSEGWRHYKRIGLPPIDEGKPSLVGTKHRHLQEDMVARPLTLTSFEDTAASTVLNSSPTNVHSTTPRDEDSHFTEGRYSQASQDMAISPRPSHHSLAGSIISPHSVTPEAIMVGGPDES